MLKCALQQAKNVSAKQTPQTEIITEQSDFCAYLQGSRLIYSLHTQLYRI